MVEHLLLPSPARGKLLLDPGNPGNPGDPGNPCSPGLQEVAVCTRRRMDSSCRSSGWTSFFPQHKIWWNWIFLVILEVLYGHGLKETSLLRVPTQQSPFINLGWKSSFLSPDDPKLNSGINQTKVSHYILTFYVSVMRGLLKLCGETQLTQLFHLF